MKKFNNLSINDLFPLNSRPIPKFLWFMLLISFILNIIGINWGLPSSGSTSWASDEITPASVMNGIKMKFSNGWSNKYPPLHYYILSSFYLPFYLLDTLNIINIQSLFITTLFFIIARLISVLMGTALIFFIYLCGCEVLEKKSALLASFITALTPPFLYYSKTANVDIPYLFWFVIAIYFFIRILKYHQSSDYILFAGTAVFSIATNDLSLGLLILTPFIILFSLYRYNKTPGKNSSIFKSLANKKTISALITGVLLFILFHNLIFNFSGYKRHLSLISDPSKGDTIFPNNAPGFMSVFIQTIRHLEFIFGWPIVLVCILGFIYALTKKKKYPHIFWLLAPCATYYTFIIFILRKNSVRQLIPIYILMSFFGALGLSYFLHSSRRFKTIKYTLVLILFINSALYSFSVDILMINDSRYHVEQWTQKNIKKHESILLINYIDFSSRNRNFTNIKYALCPDQSRIKEINPSYILINSDRLKSTYPSLYQKITNHGLGYKQIFRYKSSPWLSLMPEHKIKGNNHNKIITNLNLINPEIIILKKKR